MKEKKFPNFRISDLIILIIIITIVAVIAYPLYRNHIIYTKRAEARFALFKLVGTIERHYSKYHTYESATIATNPATDILDNANTTGNWYKLEISYQTDYDYILRAIPQNKQALDDIKCGILSITRFGEKKITGTGSLSKCWN